MPVEVSLPADYLDLLGRLIFDLGTAELVLRLALDTNNRWVMLTGENGRAVAILDTTDPADTRIATVSERAQDFVIEERPRAGFPAEWPPCPLHPGGHPAWVKSRGDEVGWGCPVSPEEFTPLGHLGLGSSDAGR